MSDKRDDGGPAFPTVEHSFYDGIPQIAFEYFGMTLRDYFAGQIITGLIGKYTLNVPSDQELVSKMAYELADAMMEARR